MKESRQPEFFEDDELSLVPESTEEIEEPEELETPEEEEEEPETPETEVETPEELEVDDNIYKINYDLLMEAGAIILPEDYKLDATEEGFKKALADSKESIRSQILDELTSSLPEVGVELLQYMLDTNSSNINDFLAMKAEPQFETLELNEEDSDTQEQIMRVYLSNTTQFSQEKIEKEITKYKLDDDLFSRANEAKEELAQMQKARDANFLEQQKAIKIDQENQLREATKSFSSIISSNPDISGIPFSKEEASSLTDSVFKPIKNKSGQVTTRFNEQLGTALMDPKKTAILAKILDKDFDFSFLQKSTTTKVTKNLQEKLDKAVQAKKGATIKTRGGGFDWDSVQLVPNKR